MPPILTNRQEHLVHRVVGARVAAERRALGRTVEQVAEDVGMPAEWLDALERGASPVSAAKLWALAQALGVDVDALLAGADRAAETLEALHLNLRRGGDG